MKCTFSSLFFLTIELVHPNINFANTDFIRIGRSCNELQSNLIMINHYVAFYHKIPNKNFMSIVKMKSMYVYGSYPNPVLTLPSLHHSMTKILNILFSRILYLFMGL